MILKSKAKICILFLSLLTVISAQTNIDSLIQLVSNSIGEEKVDLLSQIGKAKLSSDLEEARQYFTEGLKISQELDYKLGLANAFYGYGLYFYYQSRIDSMLYYAEIAYNKAIEAGDTSMMGGTANLVGVANFKMSKYREAAEYYKVSAKFYLIVKDTSRYLTILNNVGSTSIQAADLDTAAVYIHKAIKISERIKDDRRTAKLLTDLASLFVRMSRIDDAIEYAKRGLELSKKIDDLTLISYNLSHLGTCYRSKSKLDQALKYFRESLEISLKLSRDNYDIGMDYNNVASVYFDQQKFKEALPLMLKANNIFKEMSDLYNYSRTSSNLGDIYRGLGEVNIARKYYQIAMDNADEINNFRYNVLIYSTISEFYEGIGDATKALKYYKLFTANRDSITAQDRKDQISRLQTEYETEKKEQEIELLNKENTLAVVSLENEKLLRNSFIGGTFTFLVIAVGLFNRYRYKSKTNKKLSDLNTKLTNLNDQLEDELNQAASYIESLLPPKINDKVKTDWMFVPSSQLGGDSFGYSWLSDNLFSFYLIDVSGHGVGAALLSTTVLNLLKSKTLSDADFTDPASVLNSLNNNFDMEEHEGKYFAIWYGVLDITTNELTCASAMHPPALSVGPDGLLKLGKKDIMIGAFPEYDYKNTYYQLEKGNKLYLFSDGCFELENDAEGGLEFDNFAAMIADSSNSSNPLDAIFKFIRNK